MEDEERQEDFKPRPYQELLMNSAKEHNTIVYLPTGSGKTFIAVMLIKHMSSDLDKGKHTFFLVNTVALVTQQARYIKRHSHRPVGEYSGDLNVDIWPRETWRNELGTHQIMVMTCQIFLNMLNHGYIQLSDVNLLIFDECHHAVNDQPMRQVMQHFEHCPRDLQPRVLGLTATLLNSNCKPARVVEEVQNLETTFLSKVATSENMSVVDLYSTNPEERICYFDTTTKPAGLNVMEKGIKMIEGAVDFLDCILFDSDQVVHPVEQPPNTEVMKTNRGKVNKKLKNLLKDVLIHIEMLGLYGGSRACLAHIIQLERLRKKAEDLLTRNVFTMLITTLVAVRKLYEDEMAHLPPLTQIMRYSSIKMITLMEILRTTMPKEVNEDDDSSAGEDADETLSDSFVEKILEREKTKKTRFCTIVFVERRFTARIVYMVLKALGKAHEDFDHINPDFIVGFNNNPFNDTREGALEKKWTQDCVNRFVNGVTNVLVASDVLEEGIDVQKCNLVVKFDLPKNYRSYVQSKGRARQRNSKYFILVPREDSEKFLLKYRTYRGTEEALKNLLVGRTHERREPSEDRIASDLYDHLIEPYVTSCSTVNLASAIPLVNRYCSKLPQDKFTQLTPLWYLSKGAGNVCVYLQLPMNSPLRDIIEGERMPSKKLAKRAAALKTCRLLHEMGELDENLLPCRRPQTFECPELFPLYEEDRDKDGPRVGSKKKKRYYPREWPNALMGCRPKEGEDVFLHVIEQRPVYERPDASNNRKMVFYDLLENSDGFAILSSKPMSTLCDFPIYMNVGELQVHVKVNAACICLTKEEIELVEGFSTMLFRQVLNLMKPFLIVDREDLENSHLIVPTRRGIAGYEIDWDIVRKHQELPDIQKLSQEERTTLQITEEKFNFTVVAPWYRGMLPDQSYIVTCVCPDLTPRSPFPSNEYESFDDYYYKKYKISIVNKHQPLLEVKAISNKINCLRPRSTKITSVTSKRKRHELQEDFEENLVAELCMRFDFPSVLWLKATCLPTILHRITQLLLAEELRQTIASDTGVGCIELPPGLEWKPLTVDNYVEKEAIPNPTVHTSNLVTGIAAVSLSSQSNPPNPPNSFTATLFNWGDDKEPIDIDRNMEDVTLVEVLNYDDFISKPLHNSSPVHDNRNSLDNHNYSVANGHNVNNCDDNIVEPDRHVPIGILEQTVHGIGPELCEILQALTSASANDIINLERLETLGDSFLKFMSSWYLFLTNIHEDEGKLTCVKGKHIGNRNLYYCGVYRKLGGLMKVHDFVPQSDWIPPSMCVYRKLQQLMRMTKVSPNFLYELVIPEEEQLSGTLSKATRDTIQEKLLDSAEDSGIHSSMENFLSVQTVADKTIADGVEALIGAYLKASGVRGALKLLIWLKILPEEKGSPENLLDKKPPTACLLPKGEIEMHLEGVDELEHRLQYKFRDRSYLLQALTHASYTPNRTTDCYQRLEFLGDAILDFLITCHIYETCGKLTPGELTDLRSALVNNVTFASLAVRYGFQKFMKYSSPKLMDMVDRFVKFQDEHNHVINEEVLILLEEEETHIAEAVEVPKVLGDLFESIAGAIFLDSGLRLQEVWRVYYRLMHREINEFKKCVPKQPVRLLHERAVQPPKFLRSKIIDDSIVMIRVDVYIDGRRRPFFGFGETKVQAKRAAAKCALKELRPK
ncbi:endoribonuclease Dicer isoform X2 [Periplaneta americana]|uniref:endoribonuclease Dicer isoform X2 n=1 Tax=Periplaneta americana TaxID=6978 RepID=UPI0037E9A0FC